MSIQIYQDTNTLANLKNNIGKKAKLEDEKHAHNKSITSKSKRVPLASISNVQGSRVQPNRAAKEKLKPFQSISDIKFASDVQKWSSSIHDTKSVLYKENIHNESSTFDTLKESPMVFSPFVSEDSCKKYSAINSIQDIDAKLHGVFELPEYAQDIHNYLKKSEAKYRPKLNYMRKQTDINSSMRAILVDWLVEVSEEYKLIPQTLYLSVSYIDRFLSHMSVLRGKLQLVGAACMLVAAKFEEIYPPEVAEFVYITDDTYTAKQVLRMEHLILKTLAFDLSVPTCRDFLSRYLYAANAKPESQQKYLAEYLSELTLINCEISVKYPPSMIAASSICSANHILNLIPWTPTLEFYSGYNINDLKSCLHDIHLLHQAASTNPQQAIQQKYKSPRFGCVSSIAPLEMPCI
ncbi:G2/mitotic-specific cyclin-A [Hydra vulgaris]|uniref:G2/mitotic-specific cyclin-A n=1 Tax=Hydra vulgaris TaxID=6087 RepID=A0ABM4D4Q0_HYDVU